MVKISTVAVTSALVASVAPSVMAAPCLRGVTPTRLRTMDLTARELEAIELYERDPLFGLIAKGASLLGGLFKKRKRDLGDAFDLYERELQFEDMDARDLAEIELYERDPLFGLIAKGVGMLGSIFKKRKRDLGDFDLHERDFEDMDVRDIFETLDARGFFDDVEVRELADEFGARELFDDYEV
ncbi:hypothetical protein CC2G_001735 [Coprinopsis cinerea AmutBmut pab1-1]|nr:hypothetical protein CC2G_001735 [Coprinopsis cinerea AmutBmut pab1-1]